jgi:hypothetical protein
MEKEFVTYEQALAVKELGFNEKCLTYYYNEILVFTPIPSLNTNSFWVGKDNNFITVPLKQQVFRWFREKYGLDGFVFNSGDNKYSFNISDNYFLNTTYEEAENACIDKLIELSKQQDNGK